MTDPIIDSIRASAELIKRLPPAPRGIVANHSVPYGRAFRQWDTGGELWVWANRGELEDMPRKVAEPTFAGIPLFGIPVFYDHPLWGPSGAPDRTQ